MLAVLLRIDEPMFLALSCRCNQCFVSAGCGKHTGQHLDLNLVRSHHGALPGKQRLSSHPPSLCWEALQLFIVVMAVLSNGECDHAVYDGTDHACLWNLLQILCSFGVDTLEALSGTCTLYVSSPPSSRLATHPAPLTPPAAACCALALAHNSRSQRCTACA